MVSPLKKAMSSALPTFIRLSEIQDLNESIGATYIKDNFINCYSIYVYNPAMLLPLKEFEIAFPWLP